MEIKDKALKISGSVLKKMVEKEQQKKPGCMGFLHQPKRPAALKRQSNSCWNLEEEPLTFYLYPGEGVLDGMGRRKGERRYV